MATGACWVRCEVWLGMFSNEYGIAIGVDHPGGFISREYVQVEHEPTRALATPGQAQGGVLEEDEDFCLVELPWHESFGQRNVKVRKADVSPR